MGMDVYGRKPKSETGSYFRRAVWGWHPLAEYVREVAEDLAAGCKHWHSNDGDGLGARDSAALADVLDGEVASGRTALYVALRDSQLEAMPDEPCRWCNATGIRTDRVGVKMKQPERICDESAGKRAGQVGWCNGCSGRGSIRPHETHYRLNVEDVTEFAAFLRDSGGFKIH